MKHDPNRVLLFDTTLRDGEQSPGISINKKEKLEIAHQLARLGVDIIEAGFPIASPGDFEAVEAIAQQVHGPVIAGLARAKKRVLVHLARLEAASSVVDAESADHSHALADRDAERGMMPAAADQQHCGVFERVRGRKLGHDVTLVLQRARASDHGRMQGTQPKRR